MCWKTVSEPNIYQTYGFSYPTGLCKFVARVPVFVIYPVVINTLIGFNTVTQAHGDWH